MTITLRPYRPTDFKDFAHCMAKLQEFLKGIDPLKRLRKGLGFGVKYAQSVLEKVEKHEGVIFLAYEEGKVVGCIAGIVEKQSVQSLLMCVPTRGGRVLELVVLKEYRGRGVGKRLMQKMECYLREKKCDVILIEVFAPNQNAHDFYRALGYEDRVRDVMKVL